MLDFRLEGFVPTADCTNGAKCDAEEKSFNYWYGRLYLGYRPGFDGGGGYAEPGPVGATGLSWDPAQRDTFGDGASVEFVSDGVPAGQDGDFYLSPL